MVASRAKYLITDMGVGHLLTLDEMWSPFPWARQAYNDGELMTFHTKAEAKRFVAKLKERGYYTQPIAASDVPWNKSIDGDGTYGSDIDWLSIKDLVRQTLEVTKKHEAMMREAAADDGKTFEDFIAAAITMLIQDVVEPD
ncbi:MAG: hypothetical protein SGI77_21380 [Pirellulaceae bacterium]|nr:hypothetical protein [Pirellulaceae bacterium]